MKNESLKDIDSIIFFPIYKVVGSVFILLFSIFYFQEEIEFLEVIGIIVGLFIPLLLITKQESKKQVNLIRGLLFLLYTVFLGIISTLFMKEANVRNLNIDLLVLMNVFSAFSISTIILFYKKFFVKKKTDVVNKKGILKFSFISAVFFAITSISLHKSFSGNLAIVYTINSFSILIPIVLSIIFYKDHFNFRKIVVIALSIVSVLFFI
jgi:multidrug transporter EmrE-like cation transporter